MNYVFVIALLALQGTDDLITMRMNRASQLIDAGDVAAATADAMAQVSDVARLMGSHELARCAADATVESEPEVGQHHFRLAAIYAQRGTLYRGISSADRALELGFDTADVYATLGRLHFSATHQSQSIRASERAVALDPATAETIPSFSLETLELADYTALRQLLEGVDDRDSPSVLAILGAMSLRENDYKRWRLWLRRSARATRISGSMLTHC